MRNPAIKQEAPGSGWQLLAVKIMMIHKGLAFFIISPSTGFNKTVTQTTNNCGRLHEEG
ncbi:hypothetical protein GCM10027098_30130 [Bowmanella dokdonensis]